jgi:RNA polymerase sigma-70 factor (ECF subfamily)
MRSANKSNPSETDEAMARVPAVPFEVKEREGERALVLQAQGGSVSAFEQLVQRYDRRVFRVAQNITCHREDAEDVVQNVFVKAFRGLPLFRGDSRFYTWLARITINEALITIRRRRVNEVSIDEPIRVDDALVPREIQDWRPNPELRYSQQELRSILIAAINNLDSGSRSVFQLRDIDGLSTEETAQVLGVTSSAVKSRLLRARMRLRNSLDKHFFPTSAKTKQIWAKTITRDNAS